MRRPKFEIRATSDGKRASVHTRVELFYRRFLDETDGAHGNDEDLFNAHLKAIIWGALYIEGLVNYKLYAFTTEQLKRADLVNEYWTLTKQAKIEDKIDLVFSSAKVTSARLSELKKKFLKMIEQRNRLVHFKETPTSFDLQVLVEKLGKNASAAKWSEHTPYPKIVKEILATPLGDRLEVFRSFGDVIESLQARA